MLRHKQKFWCFRLSAFITACIIQTTVHSQNQDTLRTSLPGIEKRFLDSNLTLLATRYNIDIAKAAVIQAKLFPNPNFYISQVVYYPGGQDAPGDGKAKVFPLGYTYGETQIEVSQLVSLAGKRNKAVKLAESNTKLSEYEFYDLLRTLKYTLRTDFFNLYYLQQTARVYDEEISSLQKVVNAFTEQVSKGNISEKEAVRIKAQLYSLQGEFNGLINNINDVQSELRLLIRSKGDYILPSIDSNTVASLDPAKYSLTTLIDSAYQNRTDLKIARENVNQSNLNYSYQKSLGVPDITASYNYDKQGSYTRNINALGVAIDLPFFNRNQGNIEAAKIMIEQAATTQKSVEATVEENVNRSLQKAYDNDKLYKNIDPKFLSDFERLSREVLINYQKRNISILDFLDFYDSYKENFLQINAIQFNRISAFEDLNFYTGTNLFN